jgi:transposase
MARTAPILAKVLEIKASDLEGFGQAELAKVESLRAVASRVVRAGAEVLRACHSERVSYSSVKRWLSAFERHGVDGLRDGYERCGRKPKPLTPALQKALIASLALDAALAAVESRAAEAHGDKARTARIHSAKKYFLRAAGLNARQFLDLTSQSIEGTSQGPNDPDLQKICKLAKALLSAPQRRRK